jgi:hypothetical protein
MLIATILKMFFMKLHILNWSKEYLFIITESDLISIDLEFTGLRFDNNDKERPEDFLF